MLKILGLPKPKEMTGKSIISSKDSKENVQILTEEKKTNPASESQKTATKNKKKRSRKHTAKKEDSLDNNVEQIVDEILNTPK